jgi:hypothetical protein
MLTSIDKGNVVQSAHIATKTILVGVSNLRFISITTASSDLKSGSRFCRSAKIVELPERDHHCCKRCNRSLTWLALSRRTPRRLICQALRQRTTAKSLLAWFQSEAGRHRVPKVDYLQCYRTSKIYIERFVSHSHRTVAIIIGAAIRIWRSLSSRDQPTIHRPWNLN